MTSIAADPMDLTDRGDWRRRRWQRLLASLVGVSLLVAGCSGGGDGDQARSSADAGGAAEAVDLASGDEPDQVPPGEALDGEPAIISIADLTVRVEDRVRAGDKAIALVLAAGGSVFSQASDLEGDGESTLTLKVPPGRFEAVLDQLAALGTPLSESRSSEDVTEQVVDLEGRLATARASADRLRELLGDAIDVEAIVAVEAELTRRESEIETLEGRLRVLGSQVDLATVNLVLTEEGEPVVDDDIPGFVEGLRSGWVAIRNVGAVLLTVLGFALPFLAVLVPIGLIARWRWRKRPVKPVAAGPVFTPYSGAPLPPAPQPTPPPAGGEPPSN